MTQDPASSDEQIVIPLHEETVEFGRRTLRTGQVRVTTITSMREEIVNEALSEEHAQISTVPIGRIVDVMPEVRVEGDVTIIPVVEEVLVTEKKLFLKQEIRVAKVRSTASFHETVSLHTQQAVVSRYPAPQTSFIQEGRMPTETIVAVFTELSQAEAAISDLVAAGVPSSSIKHFARDSATDDMTTAESDATSHHRHGFWAWLTGRENNTEETHGVYDNSVRAGRTVVTVVAEASTADDIFTMLERHDPIDLDEQATAGSSSLMTPAATTGGMSGGAYDRDAMSYGANPVGTVPTGTATTPPEYEAPAAALPLAAGSAPQPGLETPAPRPYTEGLEETTGSYPEGRPAMLMGQSAASRPGSDEEVIPLSAESLQVGKREVSGGRTRVRRFTVERPVEEQIRLRDETVSVFRRPVSAGTTDTVGPDAFRDREVIVDESREEAVVGKVARVVEEVVVQKDVNERVETVRDTVRHDEVEIEGPHKA